MGKGLKIIGAIILVAFIVVTGYAALHNHQDDAAAERAQASCEGALAQYSEEITQFDAAVDEWKSLETALDRISSRVSVDRSVAEELADTEFQTFERKDCATQAGRREVVDYISDTEVLARSTELTDEIASLRTTAEGEIRGAYHELQAELDAVVMGETDADGDGKDTSTEDAGAKKDSDDPAAADRDRKNKAKDDKDKASDPAASVPKPELPKLTGTLEDMVDQLAEAEQLVEDYLADVARARLEAETAEREEEMARTEEELAAERKAREQAEREAQIEQRKNERNNSTSNKK
ncbi:MAG: hypothetical protein Q4P33_04000 [Flaviflexus sp.]|nr:hypothetical protein [Flaviflexus sp.]